jgi:hypothetical protein
MITIRVTGLGRDKDCVAECDISNYPQALSVIEDYFATFNPYFWAGRATRFYIAGVVVKNRDGAADGKLDWSKL